VACGNRDFILQVMYICFTKSTLASGQNTSKIIQLLFLQQKELSIYSPHNVLSNFTKQNGFWKINDDSATQKIIQFHN